MFSKTYKIIPKHIVYYSIGSHSAQLLLLYLQKFQHKFFNFNLIETLLSISESIGFLLVISDSRVFRARCVTFCLFFVFIHFNHNFYEQFQARPHH